MINQTTLQGRLVRDPEIRHTASGTSVCSFTVANSKKYKERENRLFLDCTAWGTTGDIVSNYFRKGSEIVVTGELWTDTYEDREGNKRSVNRLTCREVHFCGPKVGNDTAGESRSFEEIDEDDGDLPF